MGIKTIYLAGGCFWGTEHFMSQIKGVVATETGYANSCVPNPSYPMVCSGDTHAAETVRVEYDSDIVGLKALLRLFFLTIDPTSLNRQGNDIGTQYRTGIYYVDSSDRAKIEEALAELASNYEQPIVVEVLPLANFFRAEDYHQNYLNKNPGGYCHISPQLMVYVASLSRE